MKITEEEQDQLYHLIVEYGNCHANAAHLDAIEACLDDVGVAYDEIWTVHKEIKQLLGIE